MQFVVWRNSPKARVLIEFLVTIAFATAVHLLVAQIMDQKPNITLNMTTYIQMKNEQLLITNTTS
jgi:hypothetical protein